MIVRNISETEGVQGERPGCNGFTGLYTACNPPPTALPEWQSLQRSGLKGFYAMRLDEFALSYEFNEVHSIRVMAPKEGVYAAIKAVTAEEVALFRTLTWIRRFGRAGPESILNPSRRMPLLEVATRSVFSLLAEVPDREIVFGTLVRLACSPISRQS